jgi:hypothetical protein
VIPLAIAFRSDGFEFEQVARKGEVALLRKTKLFKGAPEENVEFDTFEVVIVQTMEAHQWRDGRVTPAHEYTPGDAQWGICGWSLQTRERGWEKFREVLAPPVPLERRFAAKSWSSSGLRGHGGRVRREFGPSRRGFHQGSPVSKDSRRISRRT